MDEVLCCEGRGVVCVYYFMADVNIWGSASALDVNSHVTGV